MKKINSFLYQEILLAMLLLSLGQTNFGQVQKFIFPDLKNNMEVTGNNPAEYIYKSDSLYYEIRVVEDANHSLQKYKCFVTAHVCRSEKCEIAKLIIYFDLTGRYISFDTIHGAPLTKKDHKPFLFSDYEKLNGLLSEMNSVLMGYSLEEFEKAIGQKHVDGVTGATPQILKREIIEGAAYTSYTLWHLVNNTLSVATQNMTLKNFDEELAIQLLKQKDNHFVEWTLQELIKNPLQQQKYLQSLFDIIIQRNSYIVKLAVKLITDNMLKTSEVQNFVIGNYQQISFYSKTLLLQRYTTIKLNNEFIHQLFSFYQASSPFHKSLILLILANNEGFKPDKNEIAILAEDLSRPDDEISARIYNYLNKLTDLPKPIRHIIKQFRRENNL